MILVQLVYEMYVVNIVPCFTTEIVGEISWQGNTGTLLLLQN